MIIDPTYSSTKPKGSLYPRAQSEREWMKSLAIRKSKERLILNESEKTALLDIWRRSHPSEMAIKDCHALANAIREL